MKDDCDCDVVGSVKTIAVVVLFACAFVIADVGCTNLDPNPCPGEVDCGNGECCPAGYTCASDNLCLAPVVNQEITTAEDCISAGEEPCVDAEGAVACAPALASCCPFSLTYCAYPTVCSAEGTCS